MVYGCNAKNQSINEIFFLVFSVLRVSRALFSVRFSSIPCSLSIYLMLHAIDVVVGAVVGVAAAAAATAVVVVVVVDTIQLPLHFLATIRMCIVHIVPKWIRNDPVDKSVFERNSVETVVCISVLHIKRMNF